jgi:hypothetical protein
MRALVPDSAMVFTELAQCRPLAIAITTRISSGRGVSATETVIVS